MDTDPKIFRPKLKVLIIRFSSIGDIILTSPLVRCLKKRFPEGEIHYLTKENNVILLENNPNIDKIIPYKKGKFSTVTNKLRKENYDLIIDSHNKLLSILFILRLFRPRVSIKKQSFRKWLFVKFGINLLPNKHVVELHLDTIKHLGVENDGKGLDYFLYEEDYVSPDALPLSFQEGYIALVAGAKHFTKQIPEDILIEICNNIHKPILILGDKNDRKKAENVEKSVGTKVFNGCGVFNINQSAALIDKSLGVITSDTGLMHIAAARDKNIISIWGNTIPEFGLYPYFSKNSKAKVYIFEKKDLKCRPCSRIGYNKCPKGHFKCMKNHNPIEISEIANSWE